MGSLEHGSVELRVLFGTETGNAERVASDLAELAEAQGTVVQLAPLNDVEPTVLPGEAPLLVVIATTGDGDMPYSAERFWTALTADEAVALDGLPFAVLGLGDTGYFEFCRAGELMDARLDELGGQRLVPLRKCDYEYEGDAEEWTAEVLGLLGSANGASAPVAASVTAPVAGGAGVTGADGVAPAAVREPATPSWGRERPYLATVRNSQWLTEDGALKPVRHVELELDGSAIAYQAGDSLGVVPDNDPGLVATLLEHLGESGDRDVDGRPLRTVLTEIYEISRPSRDLVDLVGQRTEDQSLATLLAGSDRRELHSYLWARDVLDLLRLPTRSPLTTAELLSVLAPLAHRSYSISSSPLVAPGRVDLAVATLRYSAGGRARAGVCSAHLSGRLQPEDKAQVFLVPNNLFRLPADDDTDIIMIGPGTGVAPFRSFLQERQARGARGSNWLFFGARHERCDFLYRDELTEMQRRGVLTRFDIAFSRDSQPKTYVQNLMSEQGKQLYQWLGDGAYLYVCGDAVNMAGDVDRVLHEIVAEHGGLSTDEAAAYVDGLHGQHRYLRDVY
jgi:sulfite reductase (NADPH) flavoprotein alpha-component